MDIVENRLRQTYDAVEMVAPHSRDPEAPLEACDDSAVYERFRSTGSEDALGALVHRHWNRLFRLANRIVRDPSLAEDAAQETLLKLARGARWRGVGTLGGFLTRLVVNEARDAAKSRRRRAARERAVGEQRAFGQVSPERKDGGDLCQLVEAELARLPEDLRIPLVLRYGEGLTHDEVGAALGVAPGTASSRIRRGLERLAELVRGSLSASGERARGRGRAPLPAAPALIALGNIEQLLSRVSPPTPPPAAPSTATVLARSLARSRAPSLVAAAALTLPVFVSLLVYGLHALQSRTPPQVPLPAAGTRLDGERPPAPGAPESNDPSRGPAPGRPSTPAREGREDPPRATSPGKESAPPPVPETGQGSPARAATPSPGTITAIAMSTPAARTGRLHGRVVDRDGKAVAGATVALGWGLIASISPLSDERATEVLQIMGGARAPVIRTDADGRYHAEHDVGRCNAVARHIGYSPGGSSLFVVEAGKDVAVPDIELARRGTGLLKLSCTVGGGRPYEGLLWLLIEDPDGQSPAARCFTPFLLEARDRASGLPMTAGRYRLTPRIHGMSGKSIDAEIEPGATFEASFVVDETPGLALRIVDDASRRPREDVRVALLPASMTDGVRSAPDGSVFLPGVGEGRHRIGFYAPAYVGVAVAGIREPAVNEVEIQVDASALRDGLEARLLRGFEVRGRMLGPDQQPIGADVFVTNERGALASSCADGLGRFSVSLSKPGRYRVVASAPGLAFAEGEVLFATRASPELQLVLAAGGEITGTVVGTDGRAVAGARVEAVPAAPGGPSPEGALGDREAGRRVVAHADVDGRFRLAGVHAGGAHVVASADLLTASIREVQVEDGRSAAVEFVLAPGGAAHNIWEGPVLDARPAGR